jgi:magnesium and cobalt transporter
MSFFQQRWLRKIKQCLGSYPNNRQELLTILESAQKRQVIDSDALEMIEGVLAVSHSRARDVMIPRAQMVLLDESQSLETMLETMLETAHSRYPVLNEARDTVVGVLLAKDVLRAVVKQELNSEEELKTIYRQPMFVPESKRLNILLRDFKASRNHMALVVDEYGELAGLVTIEDVLEQIVGEIEDEHDEENAFIHRSHKGGYIVQATIPIEVFNEFFHTHLQSDKIETLGGIVAQALGHIPQENEELTLEGLRICVLKADMRRAEQFWVQKMEPVSEEADGERALDKKKAASDNSESDSEAP